MFPAQGAAITYVRGYGLRDRVGLLGIPKRHEKRLITVVFDEFDLEAVFQAMAQAGRVEQPGRGFIYQLPVNKVTLPPFPDPRRVRVFFSTLHLDRGP